MRRIGDLCPSCGEAMGPTTGHMCIDNTVEPGPDDTPRLATGHPLVESYAAKLIAANVEIERLKIIEQAAKEVVDSHEKYNGATNDKQRREMWYPAFSAYESLRKVLDTNR